MHQNKLSGAAFFLLSFLLLLSPSCNKEDDGVEQENIKLLEYLEQMGYTAVEPTSSGLYFVSLRASEGTSPVRTDYVNINFTGRLIDGTVFETSDRALAIANNIEREDKLYGPFKFLLETMTLAGLREGLLMMKEGEIARLIMPSHLAFGQSRVGIIPSYSTLVYDVELLEVIKDPVEHEQRLLEAYLQEHGIEIEPEVSGLYYIENEAGSGSLPTTENKVVLHFQGSLIDGRVFDKSEPGKAITLDLSIQTYVPGFMEGIKKMRSGSKARFIIPSKIGFGPSGSAEGIIPPYSTLIFDVEVLYIN
jgi:FKBP-type peptidyl-prolyl cis-trans isomerase FkpA